MIGKLLHIANSSASTVDKRAFYAMKERILRSYGTLDGYDIQFIPGKICFSCEGSGVYVGYHTFSGDQWEDTCNRCFGTGYFKDPVWVVLDRYRLGSFVFHCPQERLRKEPDPQDVPATVKRINGYVSHKHYGYRKVVWATLLLAIRFRDAPLWRRCVSQLWRSTSACTLVRRLKNHCVDCGRWNGSFRRIKWRCRTCESINERERKQLEANRPL